MKSPLEEKKKRKNTGSKSEAMVDDNEGEEEEEEEGDTAPARNPKRARSLSQLWMVFFGDVNKQYTLVFGDANESAILFVMLTDSRYVVMQMN
jgi:hypothetical protein